MGKGKYVESRISIFRELLIFFGRENSGGLCL